MKTIFIFLTLLSLIVTQELAAQTWSQQTSNYDSTLTNVYFVNQDIGYVCGSKGTILKTVNGGTNWVAQHSGVTDGLAVIQFIDKDIGYASGGWVSGAKKNCTLVKTINGGDTWTNVNVSASKCGAGIWFVSADTGFYAYADSLYGNSVIAKTTNDGASWNVVYSGIGWISYFYFTDSKNGYATVNNGSVLKTTDGGQNWTSLNLGVNLWGSGIYFFSKDTGFVGGRPIETSSYGIFKTVNGGTSWQSMGAGNIFFKIFFADRNNGYALNVEDVTIAGHMIKSTDGGANWLDETPPKNNLWGIYFLNTNLGYAVGDNGVILKYSFTTPLSSVPTITSFSPTSGPIGTAVTINGANFSSTAANNIVFFGATKATVTGASTTQLTVTVPAGATYQPISVTVGGLTGYSSQPFIVTFPTIASITPGSFASKVDFATGTAPAAVAIGDIDGDGKPDLVVVNDQSNAISVFRNTSSSGSISSASFAAKVDFTTGAAPLAVAIDDIDGDGKPDLVVTNCYSNTVSVFRNTSSSGSITSGSFAAKVDYSTGTFPEGVAIGDIDGDGKPDLVVANENSNTVSVLRNTSSSAGISFAERVDFTAGTTPRRVAIGDIDGDGKPDLVVCNFNSSTVSVFRNTSASGSITSSSFAAKVDFASGGGSDGVALGDIDGDGKPDLVVSNSGSVPVSVLRNTSSSGLITSGSFAAKVDFTTGTYPKGVAIGDIDGNGKPDLVIANLDGNTVSVFRNTSSSGSITSGSFAANVDFATGTTSAAVAIGDLDGDGKPDLVVANSGSNTISVLQNTVAGPSAQPTITSFTPMNGPIGTVVTITGTNFSTTAANNIVFFGATKAIVTGASAAQLTVTVPAGATYQPITVTVAGLTGYSSQPFIVTFPTVASITSESFAPKLEFTTGANPYGVAFGDIDGDGKPDLVVGNAYSYSVSVFRNTSSSGSITSGSFAAKVDFATGANPCGLAIGDVDGDGKPDLVVPNYDNNTVSVLRNTSSSGSISFATKVDFTTGSGPRAVAIGDIDGDGKPDLVVVKNASNTVSVFRNTSSSGSITSGSFAAKVDFAAGTGPEGVAIGDIDGDGKPDLVVTNANSNTVSVLRNTSSSGSITSGSFAAKVDFATGTNPYNVAIGDIDGDGKPDVVVDNAASATVSVFRNTSTSGSITSGSFAARVDFTTGMWQDNLAIGDIDGDGKPDVVVTNGGSGNSVSVLHNIVPAPASIILLSVDSVTSRVGDTVTVPVRVTFPTGKNYSSSEVTLTGYKGALQFLRLDTNSTLIGAMGWSYQVNGNDSVVITASAGANDINNGGVLFKVKFKVLSGGCVFIPINIQSAIFNTGMDSVTKLSGGVNRRAAPIYGDVDKNGQIQAMDASKILKYLVGRDSLDCQSSTNADVTNNGFVSGLDATAILKYVVHLITSFPADSTNMGPTSAEGIIAMNSSIPSPLGSVVEVPLNLSQGKNILSFEGKLKFNPSELSWSKVIWSTLLNGFNIEIDVDSINGIVRFAGAGSLPDGNAGKFVSLFFVPRRNGMLKVSLEEFRWNEENKMTNVSSTNIVTSVERHFETILTEYSLQQNYPNPFNPSTTIRYGLPNRSSVRLIITNTLGQEVAVLTNGEKEAGYQEVEWQANVASGIYFYRIDAVSVNDANNRFVQVKKMLLLK